MPASSPSAFDAYTIQALRVSGVVVRTEASEFHKILAKVNECFVIYYEGGFLKKKYRYLASCNGFIFATQSPTPLVIPSGAEVIKSQSIWLP